MITCTGVIALLGARKYFQSIPKIERRINFLKAENRFLLTTKTYEIITDYEKDEQNLIEFAMNPTLNKPFREIGISGISVETTQDVIFQITLQNSYIINGLMLSERGGELHERIL